MQVRVAVQVRMAAQVRVAVQVRVVPRAGCLATYVEVEKRHR